MCAYSSALESIPTFLAPSNFSFFPSVYLNKENKCVLHLSGIYTLWVGLRSIFHITVSFIKGGRKCLMHTRVPCWQENG